jgi:hypothetical protein
MLRAHGNQWDEADLEPVAGFSRYHGGWTGKISTLITTKDVGNNGTVMAPRADPWLLVSIWFDLRRATD